MSQQVGRVPEVLNSENAFSNVVDRPVITDTTLVVDYGRKLEKEIQALERDVSLSRAILGRFPSRWLAVKLLEQDTDIQKKVLELEGGSALLTKAQLSYARLEKSYGEDIDVLIADRRYSYIHNLVGQVMQKTGDDLTLSDRIDRFVTHRILGIFIFLAVMWGVFKLTADVSAPLLDWVGGVISGPITGWTMAIFGVLGLGGTWIEGLVVDGIIAGVGGVLVFIPVLMSLYIALAVLEESGYMARAAFVMDGLMAKIGLQGKSFLPMMVGFGCTVPAIYATRTLENEKDRILTGLLVPFMSCGARLPVYVLFATVFFPRNAGLVVFSMYLLGIVTAILLGFVLRKTVFKDKEQTALLMELPPYHRPNLKTVWSHTWERTSSFIKSAWSIILLTSVILWFLIAIPVGADSGSFADTDVDQRDGGTGPTTFFQDLGQLVTSFGRAVVDTLKAIPLIVGINLSGDDEEALSGDLQQAVYAGFESSSGGYAALAGLAFMVFVLIYTPCMVAVAAEKHELGTKWMWYSVIGQLVLAWFMAFIVFQVGKLLLG
jgi:ferrous iron transport protein B